jgi:hypothetical protein
MDEAGAYDAQLVFLQLTEAAGVLQVNEAAALTIQEVRRAKALVLNREASGVPPAP